MFDVGQKQTLCLREHDVCFSTMRDLRTCDGHLT